MTLAGCRHDSDSPTPSDELAGNWRLTGMQCYCAYDPNIVEVLTLSNDLRFRLVRAGSLIAQGTYVITQGSACVGGPVEPYLQLTSTMGTVPPSGVYAVRNSILTITQCVAVDGPAYTFQRQ